MKRLFLMTMLLMWVFVACNNSASSDEDEKKPAIVSDQYEVGSYLMSFGTMGAEEIGTKWFEDDKPEWHEDGAYKDDASSNAISVLSTLPPRKEFVQKFAVSQRNLENAVGLGAPPDKSEGKLLGVNVYDEMRGGYDQIDCVEKGKGTHCRVWDDESNPGSDADRYQKIAEKFDKIYELITPVFGKPVAQFFEDGEPMPNAEINIVVTDIQPADAENSTYGFFNSIDYCENEEFSNQGLYFYLDTGRLNGDDDSFNMLCSTLTHEFTHMCNFSKKCVEFGLDPALANPTWWTEMCAMNAEDMIGEAMGVEKGLLPLSIRSTYYLFSSVGINKSWTAWPMAVGDWPTDAADQNAEGKIMSAYAVNYLFGAFLARNFGDKRLFQLIAQSNAETAEVAISNALDDCGVDFPPEFDEFLADMSSFEKAKRLFPIALVNNFNDDTYSLMKKDWSEGDYAFKKIQVRQKINGEGGASKIALQDWYWPDYIKSYCDGKMKIERTDK